MGFTAEDRHLTKSYETAIDGATRLCKMFSDKNGTLTGLKTLIKKIDNTGTIKQLTDSGRLQRTNMHLSRRSYLIILLTEVRVML